MTRVNSGDSTNQFSDLLQVNGDGSATLLPGVHPLPNLLSLETDQVLDAFRQSQLRDFTRVINELEADDNPLHQLFEQMRVIADREPGNRFSELDLFKPGALQAL
ncbi:MAG: hypothetical protein B6D79_02915, partial [gamma proteobacterium symbiont of Ctena orbiculata]